MQRPYILRVSTTRATTFIACQAREVVAGKVKDGLSCIHKFGLWTCSTLNDGNVAELHLFVDIEQRDKRLWCPFVDKFVDFLLAQFDKVLPDPSAHAWDCSNVRTANRNNRISSIVLPGSSRWEDLT